MASNKSNKDLKAEIVALCAERDVTIPTDLDDLKNDKLSDVLDGLKAAAPPATETATRPLVAPSPPDGAPPPGGPDPVVTAPPVISTDLAPPAAATPLPASSRPSEPTGNPGYFVAEGKTVNPGTGREALGAFEQVYARDFGDGQDSLDRLLAAGYLFQR